MFPYADLTETILEMGKIKPNKSKREYNPEYFREFNQMIEKLYEINKEYELVKAQKKSAGAVPRDAPVSAEEEEEEQNEMEAEPSEMSESRRSEHARSSPEKAQPLNSSKVDNAGESSSPRKKNKRPKKRVLIHPPSLPQEILFKEHPLLPRGPDLLSSRRCRRPINYMKLNEGILCESERPEVDETNYESDLSKKRLEHPTYDPFEERQEGQNL